MGPLKDASRPLELSIDAVGIDLPKLCPTDTGASLLDPVPMVRQDLDEMGPWTIVGKRSRRPWCRCSVRQRAQQLAGDALIPGEHYETMATRMVDPRLVVGLLRPRCTVNVDKGGRGPSELSAGARHQVGRQTAIDQDARRRAWWLRGSPTPPRRWERGIHARCPRFGRHPTMRRRGPAPVPFAGLGLVAPGRTADR